MSRQMLKIARRYFRGQQVYSSQKDYQAVRNTIRTNVTNGITEGYVNKLKAVKRMMYGRAGIKLLKRKLVMEHILFN